MTTTDTLQALTDAFTAAQIDTPAKITAFVQIAALQVQLNTQQFQLQQLRTQQGVQATAAQAAVEAQQTTINATATAILAAIAAQATPAS